MTARSLHSCTGCAGHDCSAPLPLWSAFRFAQQRSLSAGRCSSTHTIHSPASGSQAHTTNELLLPQNLIRSVCRCNKVDGALPIYLANWGKGFALSPFRLAPHLALLHSRYNHLAQLGDCIC